MFSIAAINDTDSKTEWQPLAPTKEAQEFHLSQLYHDGLLKLQAKDYVKARELLETVLKDPLVANAKVEKSASDGHLLQLRYLALKNLATVSLEQGPAYHETALQCYLQAVEIDDKDSVVWNQLGTLSCSMGSLSISRWAFEQGLVCSPRNWNCMEKLLEVLIAIGDEMACLSVAELILKHWPSHSRALHVKSTIEEPNPIPFAPKGIDKLEPKHKRLKFPDKRKETDEELEKNMASKKLQENIEVQLLDVSWVALAHELVNILCPTSPSCDASQNERYVSRNVPLIIQLPSNSSKVNDNVAMGEITSTSAGEGMCFGKVNSFTDKEESIFEEQPQERRSTRLERRRTRKPGKEESEFSSNKDHAKVVKQYLAPYLVGGTGTTNCNESLHGAHAIDNSLASESPDVIEFIQDNPKNFGAYHMSHLLLEKIANKSISYPDKLYSLILDLEKLTRNWGQERSPECNLFLSELCYDLALKSSEMSTERSFMEEASYHVCKIIEYIALELADRRHRAKADFPEPNQQLLLENPLLLKNSHCFWIRYYWLSGRLSLFEGDKEKAQKNFSVALALFIDKDKANEPFDSIILSHCKVLRKLTVIIVLHEVYMIEVDYLLRSCVHEMFEKKMHAECVNVLAPLLLLEKDVHLDVLHALDHEGKGFNEVELPALDILIKSCELTEPMDVRLYFSSHRRKLHILISGASLEGSSADNVPYQKVFSSSESQVNESQLKQWNLLVAEEVKAISQSASKIKSISDSNKIPMDIIGDIQSLLLTLMCNIANSYLGRKSSVFGVTGQREEYFFVDAAIAFCKLQHWNLNASIKSQAELIVAIHDMLAEFGICCACGNGEEEGTFLKLAIKHLLSLDMKLKSNTHSHSKEKETKFDEHLSSNDHGQVPGQQSQNINLRTTNESDSNVLDMEENDTKMDETDSLVNDAVEGLCSKSVSSSLGEPELDKRLSSDRPDDSSQCRIDLTEYEREELELSIDSALDQCFYCLYGLNLRSDSSSEEDLVSHKNTCQGDYQTKEQCADVFQYILPYAKASSRTGLVKLRKVLRAIRKHFPQPPDNVLAGNAIDKFLDDPGLCEDKLSEKVGSDGFLNYIMRIMYPDGEIPKQRNTSSAESCDAYLEVYRNLYYLIAQSEEISATDKWAGFILTKEGEEYVELNTNLFKYDLLYNPLRFESWQGLANIYDEEVDLLLNDGSKQINVSGWKKNTTLPRRVETSRRRSRRCLLMTSALAKTETQQGEIHELLALVYYDGLQNVVPFYDQRSFIPLKDASWEMFCQNSMNHFNKASQLKEDWSHKYYVGKLCEKLGYSVDISLANYAKAISLNPSAVDPFYRMHASRLKLLGRCGKQDLDALKAIAEHSFTQSTRESVMNIFHGLGCGSSESPMQVEDGISNNNVMVNNQKCDEAWNLLYSDCLSALETCVEGDLKHFHKARHVLAQGLYRRGAIGDLEKAKEELSFCFKSSRSSFTINMWEIDSTVKKGRRKTPSTSGNKRGLEVNLAESSRKFITCIRKYLLFYLNLLEETGDIFTLDRAYTSLRTDKRFSLCLEDLVPLTLGRYIKALIMSVNRPGTGSNAAAANSAEQALEKLFNLFLDQVNLWSDICNLPELKSPELSESSLYGYLYQYIQLLEINVKVEVLEAINEKIRKRLKNPKLSNSNCAKVYRHVSSAWCRSLVISMALITPLHSRPSTKIHNVNLLSGGLESEQLLCVDLQSEELWSSAFEDSNHLKVLETKWNPSLSKIKNVIIKRVSDEDLENAATVLRSSYNFYKDTSCALLPSGINLYMVPSQLRTETFIQPGIDGFDIIDMNTSRKLLMWAYSLLNGHCTNVSHVIKYCEENVKSKMKKGTGSVLASSTPNAQTAIASQSGGNKDVLGKSSEQEVHSPNPGGTHVPVLQTHSSSTLANPHAENTGNRPSSVPEHGTGTTCPAHAESLPICGQFSCANVLSGATQSLVQRSNPVVETISRSLDLQNDAERQETVD